MTSQRRSRRSRSERGLGHAEPLEPRLALAVVVSTPLPDITVPAVASTQTLSVAGRFDDPAVTGTVVQFTTNAAAPNDRLFVELFDQAGQGRTRTTPLTTANFLSYVDDGRYADTIIHRSVANFVVQGGGFRQPTVSSNQAGGTPPGISTRPAITNEAGNANLRGTIAMARTSDPNSATSQWYFNLQDNPALDKAPGNDGYAVFGRVLGNGMAAVDAMAAVRTYNRGGVFNELPLRGVSDSIATAPTPFPTATVVQPSQYVTLPSIRRVGELVYTATSSNPGLVAASFVADSAGTNLRLDHVAGQSGTATITVRATSVFDPTDFTEDQFTVVRQAATGAAAPTGVAGIPGNGRVIVSWTPPASSGDAPITDYIVQSSSDNGSTWNTFADGVSTAPRATVTGLMNGTAYVFRVVAVTATGSGDAAANSVAVTPRSLVAVGEEVGPQSAPVVRLVDVADGRVIAQVTAFEQTFHGGARVGMGDLDGDGIAEVAVASGAGRSGEIRVYRQQVVGGSIVLAELPAFRTQPFGPRYTGGVDVAVGDVDGDGRGDLIAAMSRGAGTVNVFRAVNAADPIENTPFRTFTPPAARFGGGATVAVADVGTFAAGRLVNATASDGRVEILVGSGPGVRPVVRVYDVSATPRVVATITPFTGPAQGGVSISAARVNDDAIDDIVVSSGRGGRSAVRVFNGRVDQSSPAVLVSSAAFATLARPNAPVFTVAADRDGDGTIDRFLCTQGDAGGSAGLLNVALNGTRVGALGTLKGPLRIAAPRQA